jgi:hypothetical protein
MTGRHLTQDALKVARACCQNYSLHDGVLRQRFRSFVSVWGQNPKVSQIATFQARGRFMFRHYSHRFRALSHQVSERRGGVLVVQFDSWASTLMSLCVQGFK